MGAEPAPRQSRARRRALRRRCRAFCVAALVACAVAITAVLFESWFRTGRKRTTTVVRTRRSSVPLPPIVIYPNPVWLGTCGVVRLKHTFMPAAEHTIAVRLGLGLAYMGSGEGPVLHDYLATALRVIGTLDILDIPDSVFTDRPSEGLFKLSHPLCADALNCTKEELCPDPADPWCYNLRSAAWWLDGRVAQSGGIQFEATGDVLMLRLEFSNFSECVLSPSGMMQPSVGLYFIDEHDSPGTLAGLVQAAHDALPKNSGAASPPDEMAAKLRDITRHWGAAQHLAANGVVMADFYLHELRDLDGRTSLKQRVSLTQRGWPEDCADHALALDGPPCGNASLCQADIVYLVRCMRSCGACRTAKVQREAPSVMLMMRMGSMEVEVRQARAGQSAGEFFGHIFDWYGMLLGASLLGGIHFVTHKLDKQWRRRRQACDRPAEAEVALLGLSASCAAPQSAGGGAAPKPRPTDRTPPTLRSPSGGAAPSPSSRPRVHTPQQARGAAEPVPRQPHLEGVTRAHSMHAHTPVAVGGDSTWRGGSGRAHR
eukprot:TRINITY_DN40475_c0_g1_i1.p1 TRINITY_DN40475_c0_g1~~TRINITY_DN40475_c0_g1_i1.p1  ORF type:complete len:572 (+),score=148.31 TRINITY_DN40475_c0_g1_i1:89-1717(+)